MRLALIVAGLILMLGGAALWRLDPVFHPNPFTSVWVHPRAWLMIAGIGGLLTVVGLWLTFSARQAGH